MHLEIGPLVRTFRRQPAVLALVVLEIAAGVATISAMAMSGSWYRNTSERMSGLDEENLIQISTYTPGDFGPARDDAALERSVRVQQAADQRVVAATPGVLAVTEVSTTIVDDRWSFPTLVSGTNAAGERARRAAGWIVFTDPAVVSALGLRFLAGGPLPAAASTESTPSPVLLTKTLAETVFGSVAAAVGSQMVSAQNPPLTVVGVVDDVRVRMPFMPHGRAAAFVVGPRSFDHIVRLVVRIAPGQRPAMIERLRAALAPDARGRYARVSAFESSNSFFRRVGSGLFHLLEVFGIMLGMVVLLGALAATSFLVAQRTRQIGIRRALGATKADIVAYFMVESCLATALGSLLGLGGTALLYRMMQRVFNDITFDVRLIGFTLGGLGLASVLATLIPALRAARVPPSVASRSL